MFCNLLTNATQQELTYITIGIGRSKKVTDLDLYTFDEVKGEYTINMDA